MNHIKHLHGQVKKALLAETGMSPEERSLHCWQFICTLGPQTIVVSKGGANTMGLRINNGENKILAPLECLATLEEMAKDSWSSVYVADAKGNLIKSFPSLRSALNKKPSKERKGGIFYLYGVSHDGKPTRIYKSSTTLQGGFEWIPVGAKTPSKKPVKKK